MKQILSLLLLLLAGIVNFHCGGSSGTDSVTEGIPIHPNQSTNTSVSVGIDGGSVELPGVAKLEFPEGSFSKEAQVQMELVEDAGETADYNNVVGDVLEGGGPAYSKVLKITAPEQPQKDAVIQFTIPQEFSTTLKQQGLVPKLYVKYFWENEMEKLDDYSTLSSELSGNVLTMKIEGGSFTDERDNKPGVFESLVLLGSGKDQSVSVKKNFSISKSAPEISSNDFCFGSTIANPLRGQIILGPNGSAFGWRDHPIVGKEQFHKGADLRASTGDDVLAIADGTITRIGFDYKPEKGTGYGRYIVVTHQDGSQTLSAHFLKNSTDQMKVGDAVKRGDVIGKADSSGGTTGPHLHFEYSPHGDVLNKDNTFVINPLPCIHRPVTIISIDVGTINYETGLIPSSIPFTVHFDIPEGNGISEAFCEASGDEIVFAPDIYFPPSTAITITRFLNFAIPRGQAFVIYKITDSFGFVVTKDFQVSWDCCDDPDSFYFFGIKYACAVLGDTQDVCR